MRYFGSSKRRRRELAGAETAAPLNPDLNVVGRLARNSISMVPALLSCFMHIVKLLLDVGALRPIRHVRDAFAEFVLSDIAGVRDAQGDGHTVAALDRSRVLMAVVAGQS